MQDPRECLCFALDVQDRAAAGNFVTGLSDVVGLFKVGLELFVREGPDLLEELKDRGARRIFLDLKFHDIPRTVHGALRSASLLPVEFLSVHAEALWQSRGQNGPPVLTKGPKLLGITVLTSLGEPDLEKLGYGADLSLKDLVLLRASIAQQGGCAGVVCSAAEVAELRARFGPGFLLFVPGIRPEGVRVSGDDQSRAATAYDAILRGADCVIVGRPIRQAADPVEAAGRLLEEIRRGLRDRSGPH